MVMSNNKTIDTFVITLAYRYLKKGDLLDGQIISGNYKILYVILKALDEIWWKKLLIFLKFKKRPHCFRYKVKSIFKYDK